MIRLLLIPPTVVLFIILRRWLLDGWRTWREFGQIVFLFSCLGTISGFWEDDFISGLKLALSIAVGGTLGFGIWAWEPYERAPQISREAVPITSRAEATLVMIAYLILAEMVLIGVVWTTGWMGTVGRVVTASIYFLTIAILFFAHYRLRHRTSKNSE